MVILADDLGHGQLGGYGQRTIRTPSLDRLAAEGVRFTGAYGGAPVCAPSRAAMLTGRHTGHGMVRENPAPGLPQSSLTDLTFAELARSAGYRTACIGKWGFGPDTPGQESHPLQRGFDRFEGYLTHRKAHRYRPTQLWSGTRRVPMKRVYAPDLFAEQAVEFIRSARHSPFLLYFATNLPHAPSTVPDLGRYRDHPWSEANRGHAAQITRLDRHVKAIMAALHESGVADHTLVLFASDNGAHEEKGVDPELFRAGGGLRGYKRNLYEGGIRVPLIAWSPSIVARPGTTVSEPVALWDLPATVADLTGSTLPAGTDSRSLLPALTGSGKVGHDFLYWYRREWYTTRRANAAEYGRGKRVAEAVRRGRWKAVRFAPGVDREAPDSEWEVELYNLATDPGERRDLAYERSDLADELVGLMRDSWMSHPSV
ncbi:arylsulfatase [Nonomuraea sp. NPDC050663]|uniref:arylsulfatase n=1 Tax=Nonomuraea sp. NPDC050663 TaxID=3364370 RepID=UPI00378DD491